MSLPFLRQDFSRPRNTREFSNVNLKLTAQTSRVGMFARRSTVETLGLNHFALQQFSDNPSINYIVQQLLYQTPIFLAALLGVVLSFIFIRRYKSASFLALFASATIIIGSLLVILAQAYLFSMMNMTISRSSFGQVMTIVGWIGAIFRGVSIALLVIAVFIGRKGGTPTL